MFILQVFDRENSNLFCIQAAISALLIGTAVANPFPPSVTVKDDVPTKIAHYTPKFPGSGNFMPAKDSKKQDSRVSRALKRATGERVSNGNVANYNVNNINDGVGSGSDSYTMYWGDGSTGAGWPAKSRWVSFENMLVLSSI